MCRRMSEHQVVVVGAGPAGVAAAVALKDVGLRPLLVDEADEVASAWRARYDRLRLNTCRPYSHLPGRRFAKGTPMFPSRDQLVEHLDRHAHEDGIELQLGTRVERIDRSSGHWTLDTSEGELRAPQVVVATATRRSRSIPDWPGRERFGGAADPLARLPERRALQGQAGARRRPRLLGHGDRLRPRRGRRDARSGSSARTPPNIVLRTGPGGLPGDMIAVVLLHLPARFGDAVARFARKQDLGDLTEYGLPVPEEGVMTRLHRTGQAPAIVDMEVIEAIKARQDRGGQGRRVARRDRGGARRRKSRRARRRDLRHRLQPRARDRSSATSACSTSAGCRARSPRRRRRRGCASSATCRARAASATRARRPGAPPRR